MTATRISELRAKSAAQKHTPCGKIISELLDEVEAITLKITTDAARTPKRAKFERPTLEQVKSYAGEIGLNSDNPERFHDHHEARGWRLNTGPMVCWRSALRTWKRNALKFDAPAAGTRKPVTPSEIGRTYGVGG